MRNEKIRPREERLARLEGATSFRDIREGFGANGPLLTDADFAQALALARHRTNDADCDIHHCGPEALETYYGSTQRHRRRLVRSYLSVLEAKSYDSRQPPVRMAATLAAQMLAGIKFDSDQLAEFAFIVGVRLDNLQSMVTAAHDWLMERVYETLPRLKAILKATLDRRLVPYLAERAEREAIYKERQEQRKKVTTEAGG